MSNDMSKQIQRAEIRRLIRYLAMERAKAKYKQQELKEDPFAMYHFAQALAYEDAIEKVQEVFHDELGVEDVY